MSDGHRCAVDVAEVEGWESGTADVYLLVFGDSASGCCAVCTRIIGFLADLGHSFDVLVDRRV